MMLGWLGGGLTGLGEGGAATQASASRASLDALRGSGIGLLVASGALTLVGVPLWSIGARRSRKASLELGTAPTGMQLRF